jgi:hypothetical protein
MRFPNTTSLATHAPELSGLPAKRTASKTGSGESLSFQSGNLGDIIFLTITADI